MRRAALLVAIVMIGAGCATSPPDPVVWYVVSPVPSEGFPHGNLNSPMYGWEKVRNFSSAAECRSAIQGIHNDLHRPVQCVASNDPRLLEPP